MPAGNKVAELLVGIGVDLADFKRGMKDLDKQMVRVGRRMKSVGKVMTLGLTAPLVAFGAKALKNWDAQEKAIAKVRSGLISTGHAAGLTLAELTKAAADLQKTSLFGDEAILDGVTAQLLTFTNVTNEQFPRAQKAIVDLAAKLGTDLKSASIQVGKALNDPSTGLSMLARSGIQFTDAQEEVIKSLAATGRHAEAQSIILAELEKQFGGTAQAAANAGLGPLTQLKNRIGDLSEKMGALLADVLVPVVDKLESMVGWFESLSTGQQKTVGAIAAITAALGPLSFLLGTIATSVGAVVGGLARVGRAAKVVGGVVASTAGAVVGAPVLATSLVLGATSRKAKAGGPNSGERILQALRDAGVAGFGPGGNLPGAPAPVPVSTGGGGGGFPRGPSGADVFSVPLAQAVEPAMVLRKTVADLGDLVAPMPQWWRDVRYELEFVNEQVRHIGADMRIAFADNLSGALGQLATLQMSFAGFFKSILKGLQQQLAATIALIAKQRILNALKGGGRLGRFAGFLGGLGLPGLLVGGAAVGAVALARRRRGQQQQSRQSELKAVVVPSGDLHFSVGEYQTRRDRLGV